MQRSKVRAIRLLLAGMPAGAQGQIGTGAAASREAEPPSAGPSAAAGGVGGPAIGSTRPHYRAYAYRDRVCWHELGYRRCRWR